MADNGEIKIEKGVPMPPFRSGNRKGSKWRFPWKRMLIGDSFLVKGAHTNAATRSAVQAGHRLGCRFACRTMNGGVRVWRIS